MQEVFCSEIEILDSLKSNNFMMENYKLEYIGIFIKVSRMGDGIQ